MTVQWSQSSAGVYADYLSHARVLWQLWKYKLGRGDSCGKSWGSTVQWEEQTWGSFQCSAVKCRHRYAGEFGGRVGAHSQHLFSDVAPRLYQARQALGCLEVEGQGITPVECSGHFVIPQICISQNRSAMCCLFLQVHLLLTDTLLSHLPLYAPPVAAVTLWPRQWLQTARLCYLLFSTLEVSLWPHRAKNRVPSWRSWGRIGSKLIQGIGRV